LEKRTLRSILAPEREGVTGGWRILNIERLHNLYCLQNIISMITSGRIRCVKYVTCMERQKYVHIFVGGPEKIIWKTKGQMRGNNIEFKENMSQNMDLIYLAVNWRQWRSVVNTAMKLQVP
jgi:hypothetical protein